MRRGCMPKKASVGVIPGKYYELSKANIKGIVADILEQKPDGAELEVIISIPIQGNSPEEISKNFEKIAKKILR